MKKNSIYALMSAIALAGAVGFCGCSSSSDEIIDNPDYNPETNSVKTSITLSINPANTSAGTRQTNAIVQNAASDFRGITSMYLVPATAAITGATSMTKKLNLGDFATTDYTADSKNYKTYANQEVAVGVSQFLFLGKALGAATSASTPAQKLASGYTTNTFADDLTATSTVADLKVTAGTILSSTDAWDTQTNALADYLFSVANADGWAGNENASLNNMHTLFCRTSLTAGSANAVLLTLQNLYRKIDGLDATTVNNIRNAIVADGKAQLKSGTSGNTAVLEWQSSCTFKDFPASLGLPDGAAHYKYVAATAETAAKFEYTTATGTENTLTTAATAYVYPNELYYLTNTPIKTTANKTVTWPTTTTAWATAGNWPEATWTGTAVAGDTKNIALQYNIQYGSARLATQVKCGAATLYDNAIALDTDHPTTNREITVAANSFKLTGVIVGGQPQQVGWNFLPTTTTGFGKALYDRVDEGIDVSSTTDYSTPNYTLVFDNYKSDTEAPNVSICLEFLNNSGQDFYGKDGLILNGQKFYLLGSLNMTGKTSPVTTTDDATLKAYVPSRALRAFIQDYTTTAQFLITAGTDTGTGTDNVGSLGKALSTVPDLRTSEQEIGLSVDLTWQAGLTFPGIVLGQ